MEQDHPRQGRDLGQDNWHAPQDALDKVSVAQAAHRLGITQDAIRKRIARGTVRYDKNHEGRIFVYLDSFKRKSKSDQENGQDAESKTVSDANQDKYTRGLEDQIAFLRRELERKDTIIMSLAQRIPQLKAAPEPREARVRAPEGADKGSTVRPRSSTRPRRAASAAGGGRSSGWNEGGVSAKGLVGRSFVRFYHADVHSPGFRTRLEL